MHSVRRRPHFVSLISFSLAWFLCVLFASLIFITSASAAPVTYETVRVGSASYAPSGVTSPITFKVSPPGVSKYHQITPVANKTVIGNLARGAIRGGGVGIAVTAVVEGLGYLIDQATGQITKEVSEFGGIGSSHSRALVNVGSGCSAIYGWDYCVPIEGTSSIATYRCSEGSPYLVPVADDGRCYPDVDETVTIIDLDPADYTIIDNAVDSSLSLSQKGGLISNAVSNASPRGSFDSGGYPITLNSSNPQIQNLYSLWPELQVSIQNLINAEMAAYLAQVDDQFTPSPDEQVIVDSGNNLPPMEPPPGDIAFEFPPFCEWAEFICRPFVGGDHPDVPVLDLETPEYDSGLPTNGVCPAPIPVVTGFGTWEITFQFACDMAEAIRTPLIAISYLMAGFIVVGVRR